MARTRMGQIALVLAGMVVLTACEEGKDFELFKKKTDEMETAERAAVPSSSVKLVERDVESPEVFQVSEQGLWDGRPSLGGVWVAHSDVKDPERVIIRNEDNGKFVIGALFRRERENPGPRLQVSSDAAAALGMLAGAPDKLNVTALRRAEVPVESDTENADAVLQPAPEVETASLDPIAAASAAIDDAEAEAAVVAPVARPEIPVTPPRAVASLPASQVEAASVEAASAASVAVVAASAPETPARPAQTSRLSRPFIQIGLFSEEENAERTGIVLRGAGVVPNIEKKASRGKEFWRVTVGPARTSSERSALLNKIKGLGYEDAYIVRK